MDDSTPHSEAERETQGDSAGDRERARTQERERLRLANLPLFAKLAMLAAIMFGFGWAMVPLYNAICEATGLRVLTKVDENAAALARNTQVDTSRTIVVEFDSNSHGPWRFKPQTRSVEVHPGALTTVEYELVNTVDHAVAGQAIPSYAPRIAGPNFHKVECFCFQQQLMQPKETRRFPVVFFIDPKLPAEITTITLSYTFFDVAGPNGGKVAGTPSSADAPGGKG